MHVLDKSRVSRISRCTNYGMAFTKNGDPTDTKFAMIDRSIAHLVRSIGKKAHTDSEFNEQKPAEYQITLFGVKVLSLEGFVECLFVGAIQSRTCTQYVGRLCWAR